MSDIKIEVREDGETYVVTDDVGYKYLNTRVTELEGSLEESLKQAWENISDKVYTWLSNLQVNIVENKIVDALPDAGEPGVLYLVPNEEETAYTSYIYSNDMWVKLAVIDFTKYVLNTRKVNGKALSSDITLTATDIGGYQTTASGSNAHAEGLGSIASGDASHAEGRSSEASGPFSHAEGVNTEATVLCAHVEGALSKANGHYSHAEGSETKANGENSHAEGWGTIAEADAQHVQGTYNVVDSNNSFAWIVGNGLDVDGTGAGRSNASALDWNGNLYLGGSVYINCDENSENGTKVSLDAESIIGLMKDELYKKIYPVGSVYMTSKADFNPNTSFGGTWTQITSDSYLKAVTTNGGTTGGELEHKITSDNLPNHTHNIKHSHQMANGYYLISSNKSWEFETFNGVLSDGNKAYKLTMVKNSSTTSNRKYTDSYTGTTSDTDFLNSPYYPGYYGVYVWERTE